MPSLIADLLDRLDPERRYELEERAGTIEFDSGTTRDEAEALALIDLLRSYPGALVGVTAWEVERDHRSVFVLTTNRSAPHGLPGPALRTVDLAGVVRTRFSGIALLMSNADWA